MQTNRKKPVPLPEMEATTTALTDFGALIPAAGFSGRMGMPKAFLPFDREHTFVEKIVEVYLHAGVQKVVVVLNRDGAAQLRRRKIAFDPGRVVVVAHSFPERGRFFSIQTGLKALGELRGIYLQNIDNPFAAETLLHGLAKMLKPGGYVVPQYGGRGGHPVLLSGAVAGRLTRVAQREANLRDLLRDFPKTVFPANDDRILTNINTPEEYRKRFGKPPAAGL